MLSDFPSETYINRDGTIIRVEIVRDNLIFYFGSEDNPRAIVLMNPNDIRCVNCKRERGFIDDRKTLSVWIDKNAAVYV